MFMIFLVYCVVLLFNCRICLSKLGSGSPDVIYRNLRII